MADEQTTAPEENQLTPAPVEAEQQTAPNTEAPSGEQPVEQPKPAHKEPGWVRPRINEITREKHDAIRRAEAAEREAADLRAKLAQQAPGEAQTPQAQPQPVPDIDVLVQQQAARLLQQNEFNRRCNEVADKGATEFQDFQQTIQNFDVFGGLQPDFLETVVELPDPHKILHHLGNNLEDYQRIQTLPPVKKALALADLASKLNVKPAQAPLSAAPAPVKPVGSGNPAPTVLSDNLSDEEWFKQRNATASRKIYGMR